MAQDRIAFKEMSGIWIVAIQKTTPTDKAGPYLMLFSAGPITLLVRIPLQSIVESILIYGSSWNCALIRVLLACSYRRTCLSEV